MPDLKNVFVEKKDGTLEEFNTDKIKKAIGKSSYRALAPFKEGEVEAVCDEVIENLIKHNNVEHCSKVVVPVKEMHLYVELALEKIRPEVAKTYRDYRDYKQEFVEMMDDVYIKSQTIMYRGDKENSNSDSALVSTKRSLVFNQLNKSLYQKFFMTTEELQACKDGYIYIHDMSARRDSMNCCLFDMKTVLDGGFNMGNMWYNEPKTLDTAFDVIGDVVLATASQQYGE